MSRSPGPSRQPSLDGLRGLAAAVVVVHHSLLTVSDFALPYFTDSPGALFPAFSWQWWFVYSPVHDLWDGTAAVYVFFILSGFVLTLPLLSGRSFSWLAYYPRRLLRIYLPVWAAIALAILNLKLFERDQAVESPWLDTNRDPFGVRALISDAGLLAPHGFLLSPLWSLHFEIVFSLALPLFGLIAIRLKRWAFGVGALSLIAITLGAVVGSPWLQFMPMFLLGAVLATELDQIERFVDGMKRAAKAAGMAIALVLISVPWVIRGVGANSQVSSGLVGVAVFGALLLVVGAVGVSGFRHLLTTRSMLQLGTISFSLYLVHEPVVIVTALLFRERSPFLYVPLSWVASIGLAVLFYILVERNAHRLARRVGRRVERLTQR